MPNVGAHLRDDGDDHQKDDIVVSSDELTVDEYDKLVECEVQLSHYHGIVESAVIRRGVTGRMMCLFTDHCDTLFVTVEPALSGWGVFDQHSKARMVTFGWSMSDAMSRFADMVHQAFTGGVAKWWHLDDTTNTGEGRGF
jgi:hypothetical protein